MTEEKHTTIQKLSHDEVDEITMDIDFKDDDEESLYRKIFKFELPVKVRMRALELYYSEKPTEITEVINKLCVMYLISGISLLQKFLNEIALNSNLEIHTKVEVAKTLAYRDPNQKCIELDSHKRGVRLGFEALNILCKDLGDMPVPCKVENVIFFMKSPKHKLQALLYFCEIINDKKIECDYRYRTILSLEHKLEKETQNYYLKGTLISFMNNHKNNPNRYRILAGHYLLEHLPITEKESNTVQQYIWEVANTQDLDYDLRADATDILLHIGNEEYVKQARSLMLELGRHTGPVRTIYQNAQNVHIEEIEESAIEILEFLVTFYQQRETKPNFKAVEKEVTKLTQDWSEDERDRIQVALNRIYVDRVIYTQFNVSLRTILSLVWLYACEHEEKEEMTKRIVQELIDMAGTCSSGFAMRLINSITGFGNFSLRISWEEQIAGNLAGRLNKRIRQLEDEDYKSDIMVEMAFDSSDRDNRKHFMKFFRENISQIREEMWSEFTEFMDDTSWDLYFRKALMHYEGMHA